MIQFILMLLGLAFPNNNANTATNNDRYQVQPIVQSITQGGPANPVDTGGEDGVIVPPKK